ncbi:hypothetical protein ACFY8W_36955 [Streptomyces sp. NPDC012637]|uniref:hypothetical protein n=1 Tax=Streptomyces sp. NPDC012637 TaxID=3364842 RepID=UPI0036EA6E55
MRLSFVNTATVWHPVHLHGMPHLRARRRRRPQGHLEETSARQPAGRRRGTRRT